MFNNSTNITKTIYIGPFVHIVRFTNIIIHIILHYQINIHKYAENKNDCDLPNAKKQFRHVFKEGMTRMNKIKRQPKCGSHLSPRAGAEVTSAPVNAGQFRFATKPNT